MTKLRIEWDESKNATNIRRHGVSFDEASTVFSDPHALLRGDPDHSGDEDRFILMGFGASLRGPGCLPLLSTPRPDHQDLFGTESCKI